MEFLHGANWDTTTMGNLIEMTWAKYSQFDLRAKKDYIRSIVRAAVRHLSLRNRSHVELMFLTMSFIVFAGFSSCELTATLILVIVAVVLCLLLCLLFHCSPPIRNRIHIRSSCITRYHDWSVLLLSIIYSWEEKNYSDHINN